MAGRVVDSDTGPDPDWIRIQKFCGSGSGLSKKLDPDPD
jgi:hypothetical protein